MTWASRLLPACQELADLLTAAGVPATLNKDRLETPGAWITPGKARGARTLAGGGVVEVSVLLVVPAAKEAEALKGLGRLLELALTVIDPDGAVDTSIVLPHNNNALPAFRLPVNLDL